MTKETIEQRIIREAAGARLEREQAEKQRLDILLEAFRL
jgi:hypothetical protein